MDIQQTDEGFTIPPKPGRYLDRKAANFAKEFSDEELRELEERFPSEMITYGMLQEKAMQRTNK